MGEAKRKAKLGVAASPCRGCTYCCTLPEILALDKPMYRPCGYIAAQASGAPGCGLFGAPERPGTCRAYECAYLTAQRTSHPDRRRIPHPLDAGAYFHKDPLENALVVFVDPDRPLAWKSSALVEIFRSASVAGMPLVIFDRGRRMTIRTPRHYEEILRRDMVAFADAQGMPREIASFEAERAPQPSATSSGSAIP
ncbi:hypothetical protein [Salinarimonas rosea]|uniref:hypothetical protein n=1 Tax=Salinarimonas rosea TaxID=552063 RepID=UPI0004279C48|nr:hypothetical protein [Salinarimonas rosea]